MAAPLTAAIPPGLDLGAGYVVEFTALDASTGAVVSGVNVSNAALLVTNVQGGDLAPTLPDVEPLWIPIPAGELNAGGSA